MSCLVSDICNDVITELSQVSGVNTQIYGTPRIQQLLQDAIILMMDENWWPSHRQYFYNIAPDGATGRITSDLVVSGLVNHSISRFQDLEAVFPSTLNRPLRQLPPRFNPATLTGSSSIYLVPDFTFPLRPFAVLPVTSADLLTVIARAYPAIPIGLTDTVYLDRLMLTYLTAYMYEEDDATNPGAIAKFKNLFEKRLSQVKASWSEHSIPLDPRFATTEYEWSERE
jgi:hypothetical protein